MSRDVAFKPAVSILDSRLLPRQIECELPLLTAMFVSPAIWHTFDPSNSLLLPGGIYIPSTVEVRVTPVMSPRPGNAAHIPAMQV